MSAAIQQPGKLTFQEITKRLPPEKVRRLIEIKKAYPHLPLEKLPDAVKREAQNILQSVINAQPAGQGQTGQGRLFSVIGTNLENNKDIVVYQKDRTQGLYVIGTTGTGKSTLLANLILADISQGMGVCLIEPHGDLTKTVLSCIPERRLRDVILLDLMDSEYPFGLNIFECRNPADRNEIAKTASFVFHVFEKMWGIGTSTPRLAQVLRNVTQTLIENPGTTFGEIPLLFWNDSAREELVANVRSEHTGLFWERFTERSRRDREEYVESTDNKVDAYLVNDKIRYLVSQAKTTIDFRRVMDEGKILLILLSPQLEEMSRLIGSVAAILLLSNKTRTPLKRHLNETINIFTS